MKNKLKKVIKLAIYYSWKIHWFRKLGKILLRPFPRIREKIKSIILQIEIEFESKGELSPRAKFFYQNIVEAKDKAGN